MKPIIGIVGRSFKENQASVIEVNEDYRLAIVRSGGNPIIIVPNNDLKYGITEPSNDKKLTLEEKNDLYKILSLCDGILMTGGSKWYNFDEEVCKYALDNDIPILGICLGMQILGNVDNFNKSESSDKTEKNETTINHCQENVKYVHKCNIKDGFLFNILNAHNVEVNSRHNYHITEKDYFIVDSYSEDGLIEAIHIPNKRFALGVQWHPENMIFYDNNMIKIFESFIKAATK